MSLLNFLKVIDGLQSRGGKDAPPPRNRRLELERLERRAVLAVLDAPMQLFDPVLIAASEPTLEVPPLTDPLPPPENPLSPDDGGSGSGTGEPGPGDPSSDPPPESPPTDGGSGSGTGDPPSDPPPPSGGSGSGTGTGGEAPVITSLGVQDDEPWVWIAGTVTDSDGPVEGMIIYFTVGEQSTVSFTATVEADGSFRSMNLLLEVSTLISAYTIDAQGNHSAIATCYV